MCWKQLLPCGQRSPVCAVADSEHSLVVLPTRWPNALTIATERQGNCVLPGVGHWQFNFNMKLKPGVR
jgi:hypothetical protein